MAVGARVTHALLVAVVAACGSGDRPRGRSPVERAIDKTLGARFGTAVVTRCFEHAPVCEAKLADGSSLPISVMRRGTSWEWHVIGLVVTADKLEAYLRAEVAELGAPQGVQCAPQVHRITAGDRIECSLARGGKGFITVRGDGSLSVEVVLDATSANARSERITPARDLELIRASRALEHSEEMDEEEGPTPDAGELQVLPAPR
jgi:hypothetical protein